MSVKKSKIYLSLLLWKSISVEAVRLSVEFSPCSLVVSQLGIMTKDISEDQLRNSTNESSSLCDLWIEEHRIYQNWSEIEKEFLDLCVGPQRFNNPTLTRLQYLLCRLPAHILYPLTAVYILMGITGTLGNLMVQLVIFRWDSHLSCQGAKHFIVISQKHGHHFLWSGDDGPDQRKLYYSKQAQAFYSINFFGLIRQDEMLY